MKLTCSMYVDEIELESITCKNCSEINSLPKDRKPDPSELCAVCGGSLHTRGAVETGVVEMDSGKCAGDLPKDYVELIERVRKIDIYAARYLIREAHSLSTFKYSGDLALVFEWDETPQKYSYWLRISRELWDEDNHNLNRSTPPEKLEKPESLWGEIRHPAWITDAESRRDKIIKAFNIPSMKLGMSSKADSLWEEMKTPEYKAELQGLEPIEPETEITELINGRWVTISDKGDLKYLYGHDPENKILCDVCGRNATGSVYDIERDYEREANEKPEHKIWKRKTLHYFCGLHKRKSEAYQ